jgi:hypothetical protein
MGLYLVKYSGVNFCSLLAYVIDTVHTVDL